MSGNRKYPHYKAGGPRHRELPGLLESTELAKERKQDASPAPNNSHLNLQRHYLARRPHSLTGAATMWKGGRNGCWSHRAPGKEPPTSLCSGCDSGSTERPSVQADRHLHATSAISVEGPSASLCQVHNSRTGTQKQPRHKTPALSTKWKPISWQQDHEHGKIKVRPRGLSVRCQKNTSFIAKNGRKVGIQCFKTSRSWLGVT